MRLTIQTWVCITHILISIRSATNLHNIIIMINKDYNLY